MSFSVITKSRTSGRDGTFRDETNVSTGFSSRQEASRFATGLSKAGKVIGVEIREDPDPTFQETLQAWRHRLELLDRASGTVPGLENYKAIREELTRVLAILDGDPDAVLLHAYKAVEAWFQSFPTDKLPPFGLSIVEALSQCITWRHADIQKEASDV